MATADSSPVRIHLRLAPFRSPPSAALGDLRRRAMVAAAAAARVGLLYDERSARTPRRTGRTTGRNPSGCGPSGASSTPTAQAQRFFCFFISFVIYLFVAEKVASGELNSAIALVRPPGHHAEHGEAMGFCLFNNVAVAASYLLNERPDFGIKKGIDYRMGCSPWTWHTESSQHGKCGNADYIFAWDRVLLPVAEAFDPDIILVSAGFDAALGDPLGGCCITPNGYALVLTKMK
ncbi:hypothetical protein PR202_ga29274 [Eleusine coracana subsp. coracana]|uniref:Histone deacetylase domain-containing protein n=1 Tax=Eleusine coracana subsp. coracana TaxID=191504 RepID=A0AAV5DL81_ELECO|nr:hypothetical protein PR202_ga29274 [Eleusine coracana subsp. coracana]